MESQMRISIAQLAVTLDPADNLSRMLAVLDEARPGEWVAFPEGMLSGYAPDLDDFAARLDPTAIASGIEELRRKVAERRCYSVFGSATPSAAGWHNSVFVASPDGQLAVHHKIELAQLDRNHFAPGTSVTALDVGGVRCAVQACRELLFPLTWHSLKSAGATIIFHINNAIQPQDAIWRHVIVTRAVELGIFVCSVNNSAAPQALPSFLVSPAGEVLLESNCQREEVLTTVIDLRQAIPDLATRTDF